MYVKIKSWHIIRTFTRVPNQVVTLCGKRVITSNKPDADRGRVSNSFGDEKSCETCLRFAAKVVEG